LLTLSICAFHVHTSYAQVDSLLDFDFDLWETAETSLSLKDIDNEKKLAFPNDQMRFSNEDLPKWKYPEINDFNLGIVNTMLRPADMAFLDWKGIGWFRLELEIDPSLTGKELALIPEHHFGASEVYLNGQKIGGYGVISNDPDSCQYAQAGRPLLLYFSRPGRHILAFRYANFEAESLSKQGLYPGFRFRIGEFQTHLNNWLTEKTQVGSVNLFILGALIAVTLVHFLLFVFYPIQKNNFYFALFTGSLALLSLSEYMVTYITDPFQFLIWFKLTDLSLVIALLMALRFSYELFYAKKPISYYILLFFAISLGLYYWFIPYPLTQPLDLFVLLVVAELLRGLIRARSKNKEGYWIIGTGLAGFMIGLVLSILDDVSMLQNIGNVAKSGGTGLLIGSLSIFLSRNVAGTNKRLRTNIRQIRQLARQNMEQEMLTRQKELQRKLLATENNRKSEELNQARTLQLSMLPKRLPQTPFLDIAVHMDTAYEVGGDYYDFSKLNEDYITGVFGDATGHGMGSGIIVATVKSHFGSLSEESDISQIMNKISKGIRNMGLKTTFMGLIVYRYHFKTGVFEYASAGMPPIFLYNSVEGVINTHTVKSFPLGTPRDFHFQENKLVLSVNDTLLLMTDGLMELFDKNRNMLGLQKVKEHFESMKDSSPSEIILGLRALANHWAGEGKPNDDITLVCLKRRQ
jgi:serine phosphatase RsbU (regulator of sigma subunit)